MVHARHEHDRERHAFYQGLIGRLDDEGRPTEGSLLAYAEREIRLGLRLKDGTRQGDHVLAEYRRDKVWPEGWEPVECAEEAKYLWSYFCKMSLRRTSNGFKPNPLSHSEVVAWQSRARIRLEVWEEEAIDALEALYISMHAEHTPS